jgi:UTP--glucose-1-phosphate uridylyltransferase
MSKQKVTKAVIAAAGFGTRFLPQTKAMPKEMLPLIDKPIIQYVVEELVSAGIKDIIIVSGATKRAIEDHFDLPNHDLINNLKAGGPKKQPMLDEVEKIAGLANFIYIRQKGTYGNLTPVANAAHLIGDEPFIYTYADDFFVAEPGRTAQMIATYEKYGAPVLACKKIEFNEDYERYGIVAGSEVEKGIIKVEQLVEKPGKSIAAHDMASVSGYLLTPEIFQYIEQAQAVEPNGELYLQPRIQQMLDEGHGYYACEIDGTYHDTGNKLEYVKTVIDFALERDDIGPELRAHLRNRLDS